MSIVTRVSGGVVLSSETRTCLTNEPSTPRRDTPAGETFGKSSTSRRG